MKTRQKLLTDEQWELIEPLLPKPKQRLGERGRPPIPKIGLVSRVFCGF